MNTNSLEREIALIKKHYDSPMVSPLMRWNEKYLTENFKGMIPYICINDLVNYKYAICAIPKEEVSMMLMEMNRRNVVKEYDSLESMVTDGWRIDT